MNGGRKDISFMATGKDPDRGGKPANIPGTVFEQQESLPVPLHSSLAFLRRPRRQPAAVVSKLWNWGILSKSLEGSRLFPAISKKKAFSPLIKAQPSSKQSRSLPSNLSF